MFEKDAEDYVDKELKPPVIKPMVEICQECIEFGYNKGKEEQKHNTHTVAHLNDCISEAQDKKIAELEAQIEQLTYLHNEDVSTIKLLNKQIEKMKCCNNCAGYYSEQCTGCEDYCNWKLRR